MHLCWTRECQIICDLVLRSLLKRAVSPPTVRLPLQYPVSCVFFASLEGCPLPVCTMVYTDIKQLKSLSKTRQLEEGMGDGSSDLLDMTVTP